MKKAKSLLSFRWLWIFIALSLFIIVLQLDKTQETRKEAEGGGKRIEVVFHDCNPEALVVGDICHLSALVFDENSRPIYDGYRYEWSLSSTGSLGELSYGMDKVAIFKVTGEGIGNLVVRAIFGSSGEGVLKSIKIVVGEPLESNCQRRGNEIRVTPLGGEGKCHDIQEAINIAQSADQIILASGVYRIKSKSCRSPYSSKSGSVSCGLEITGHNKDNLIISGSGRTHTFIDFDGNNYGVMLSDVLGVKLRGLAFENAGTSELNIFQGKNIYVEECSFSGSDFGSITATGSSGVIIARNSFEDNLRHVGMLFDGSQGIISDNVFAKNGSLSLETISSSDLSVIRNTFYDNGISRVTIRDMIFNKAVFKNNLVLDTEGYLTTKENSQIEVDYNCFWNLEGTTQGSFSWGAHNLFVEPKIDSQAYCLMPDSPLIGANDNGGNIGAKGECPKSTYCNCESDLGRSYKAEGDGNCDGIDFFDYQIWFGAKWRKNPDYLQWADLDCDGQISVDDFEVWRRNFDFN